MNPDIVFDTDRNILRRSPGGKLEMVKLSQLLLIARAARRRRSPISGPLRAAAPAPFTSGPGYCRMGDRFHI